MTHSKVYLGEPPSYERTHDHRGPGSAGGLHVGAQRIAWGVLMGERVGLDLDAEVRDLLAKHGDHFAAHMAAAFARKAQRRDDDARVHLNRARDLLEPGHAWSMLVPSDEAWNETPAQTALSEDEPGRVYRVVSDNVPDGRVFGSRGVARFIRMKSGELVYVNPVALTDEMGERIRALGEVTHVIAPAKYHSDHAPRASELFPKARVWGVAAHRGYPNVAHVKFDGYLSDDAPLFPGELDQVTIQGVDVGDVWLVDRPSRTIIVTDAIFVLRHDATGMAEFMSPFHAFYAWAWGVYDRVGVPSYQPAMWTDIRAYQGSVRRALALDFEHLGSCHGPWRGIEGDARTKLREGLGWLLDLGRIGALGHLGDFVRRHPGVFFRLVKEQIAMAKGRG